VPAIAAVHQFSLAEALTLSEFKFDSSRFFPVCIIIVFIDQAAYRFAF
jgi:hypothetical protein